MSDWSSIFISNQGSNFFSFHWGLELEGEDEKSKKEATDKQDLYIFMW